MLADIGRLIAPVFMPLGFSDWRISTALITGFTAKEAVVSTLAVLTGTSIATLPQALSGLFTPLAAAAFLVFTLLYTPCVAAISADVYKRQMSYPPKEQAEKEPFHKKPSYGKHRWTAQTLSRPGRK